MHRPKYDDWSFPKGKLDPGEHEVTAAVREVAEETGLDVRLGPGARPAALPDVQRPLEARRLLDRQVRGRRRRRRLPRPTTRSTPSSGCRGRPRRCRLTYPYDRETLAEARPLRRRTHALVVLRHGKARARGAWRKDDRLRPLLQLGEAQAQRLVPLLAAFDVTSAHTSSSVRCLQTVPPYVDTTGWPAKLYDELSEEGATAEGVVELVDALLHGDEGAVLCTHRPVLPTVVDALGLPDVELEPGAMLVVHHRKGRVVATEVRQP